LHGPKAANYQADKPKASMPFNLLLKGLGQPLLGQGDEVRMVEDQGHHQAVNENHEGKKQVKFLEVHDLFSEHSD
jgi:hypothetical protein